MCYIRNSSSVEAHFLNSYTFLTQSQNFCNYLTWPPPDAK